jgi:signal peptidase I
VALLLRAFVVEAFKIPSGSMLPTLQIQDPHLREQARRTVRTRPFTSLPHVDVAAARARRRDRVRLSRQPARRNRRTDYIKRAIALPGDTLVVEGGHPIINGWRVPSCRVGEYGYREGGDEPAQAWRSLRRVLGERSYITLYEDSHHRRTTGAVSGEGR